MKAVWILFFVLQTHATTAQIEDLTLQYSLEQIQQISSYLSSRMANPNRKILECDPDSTTARQWFGGPFHELYDEKIALEGEAYIKEPAKYARKGKNCAKSCACDGYAAVVAKTDAEMAENPENKRFNKFLDREVKKEKPEACWKSLNWFCASDLKKYLSGEDGK